MAFRTEICRRGHSVVYPTPPLRLHSRSQMDGCRVGYPPGPWPWAPRKICRATRQRVCCSGEGYLSHYPQPETKKFVLDLEGAERSLIIETGAIGRQANGSVLARQGDTVIYTSVCCNPKISDIDFIPLSVDYVEKLSSVGRTARNYMKRDKQNDGEVLTSRIVDRSIRPLFAKGWSKETQVLETVMSYDGVNSTQPLAITAAGAALVLSDLPFEKPVAGVRVGWLGMPVINPTVSQQEESTLDLILAGTYDGIVMIEANAQFISEQDLLLALKAGMDHVAMISRKLEEWAASIRKEQMEDGIVHIPEELPTEILAFCGDRLKEIFAKTSKKERNAVRSLLWDEIEEKFVEEESYSWNFVKQAYKTCESKIIRDRILESGLRIDGRGSKDIRPIYSSANILPTTHGSALFTRGCTQALCVATLGSQKTALRVTRLQEEDPQRFYLQYSFPPSSVGEVQRFMLYPKRRELGHGQLACWALAPAVPGLDLFPYTIRVESTITESDGSSSMASVCGGYLAMMDAGVPMTHGVAGIAMGLLLDEESGKFVLLSDILGTEDALGDMDFKVAGTTDGVSAMQMDVKVSGVTFEILSTALNQAKEGRCQILSEMEKCDPPLRKELSPYAPHIKIIKIDPSMNGMIIGPGGKHIRALEEKSGVETIGVDETGEIEIIGSSFEAVTRAEELVRLAAGEITAGQILRNCVVSGVKQFGLFVELVPGRTGLLHVSEYDLKPVADIIQIAKIGDKVDVQVLSCHSGGKYSLSRKAVLEKDRAPIRPHRRLPTDTPSQAAPLQRETTTKA